VPALQAPELSDGVVRLRPVRETDAGAVIAALQDPEIPRWTRVPAPYTRAEFDDWLTAQAAARETGEGVHLLVTAPDGRLLGAVGVQGLDGEAGDIGYWVAAGARGRGVATHAVRLLRDWLAAELGRASLEILVHPGNMPSRRVAVAAGFAATGEYRRDPRPGLLGEYMVFAWPDDAGAGAGGG
jgi:RimJ/RimL family protein N-acetyltransferase